jgi:uncharacterized C2H2 Zn-finger protein
MRHEDNQDRMVRYPRCHMAVKAWQYDQHATSQHLYYDGKPLPIAPHIPVARSWLSKHSGVGDIKPDECPIKDIKGQLMLFEQQIERD